MVRLPWGRNWSAISVSLIQRADADDAVQVIVFKRADPDDFICYVDEYRQEAAKLTGEASLGLCFTI